MWIEAALKGPAAGGRPHAAPKADSFPFEDLFEPVFEEAEARLWSGLGVRASERFDESARAGLRQSLLGELSDLCAAALYDRFTKARNTTAVRYDQFIAAMRAGGFRELFDGKPVLLRLVATITRQWIDTLREFVARLDADLPSICGELLRADTTAGTVTKIATDLSDPHNGGRAVLIVTFGDGARVVYKPKDLRLDVAWRGLVERLNRAGAPVVLKSVCVIARDGYGWTEFIEHAGCADQNACERFFRRAGAWLALLHLFATTDMHQENMIAAGDHPVPIDLETILQPTAEEHKVEEPEGGAFDAALEIIGDSVMTVGLLPAYGRSVDHNVFAMGGMTADWGARNVIAWNDINSDAMRPVRITEAGPGTPNLPHVGGRYAKFGDHVESFVAGFADYAEFLLRQLRSEGPPTLFDGFAGVAVRKVVRPTRFYYMLLQRLRNHHSMDDGAVWSAQADFVARLSDWDKDIDPLWPLHHAERSALVTLNVPHFTTPSDGDTIADASGIAARTEAVPGLERARARAKKFDEKEIAWQIEVIRENTNSALPIAAAAPANTRKDDLTAELAAQTGKEVFIAEAGNIAAEVSRHAIRRGPGAVDRPRLARRFRSVPARLPGA